MSGRELTNGIEDLPPRREVRPGVNTGIWRAIAAAALVTAAASMLLTVVLFASLSTESSERRDQNCQSFEGAHLQEVEGLANSYKLLAASPPDGWDRTQRFVAGLLPKAEREAARDDDGLGVRVPDYCDEPHVGLPEPDPCVPGRPHGLELVTPAPKVPARDCRAVHTGATR